MATFTAVRNKKQTASTIVNVIEYVTQAAKTMLDGRQFYHFVQSFSEDDNLTPEEVNAIGVELAQREFPDFEVLVATHIDTDHLHNHLVVNSVSFVNGRKLHQNAADLQQHRKANDEICIAHGLSVLEPPQKHSRKKQMRPGEYQAGLRGDSWKLDLIHTINEALEYVDDHESFIEFMENEGYQVAWANNWKHITFTCPNSRKCRNSSLHDETFLKENLEVLFAYRQATGFRPRTLEPDEGWMGEAATGIIQLGRAMTFLLRLCHPIGQTANSAGGRLSRNWQWGRVLTRTKAGSQRCGSLSKTAMQ